MPYDFPRRTLRDQQVLDPDQLNADVDPVLRSVGNLDRDNLSSALSIKPKSDNANQNSGYYNHHHTSQTFDPNLGTPGAHSSPSRPAVAGTHFLVPNAQAWSTVEDTEIENIGTGLATFWVHAFVQYFWLGWGSSEHFWSKGGELPAHLQFALRVDGVIVPGTLTGQGDDYLRVCQPWRWKKTRTGWGTAAQNAKPGPLTGYDLNISGLGPEMLPVRLGAHVDVGPGTHKVELVVRRMDFGDRRELSTYSGTPPDDDVFIIGNRQVYAIEMPMQAAGSASRKSLTLDRLETEERLSEARIHNGMLKPARDYINKVEAGHLARGALTRQHLVSGVLAVRYTGIAPTTFQALNTLYPGWATHTFAAAPMGGATGWYRLDTTPGVQPLRTLSYEVTEACYILVKADVHVRAVRESTGTLQTLMGALTLGYEYDDGGGATEVTAPISMGVVNNFNINPAGSGAASRQSPEHVTVPLLLVIDATAFIGRTYNFFQVYGSVIDPSGDSGGVLQWRYCNITMLALRA